MLIIMNIYDDDDNFYHSSKTSSTVGFIFELSIPEFWLSAHLHSSWRVCVFSLLLQHNDAIEDKLRLNQGSSVSPNVESSRTLDLQWWDIILLLSHSQ